MRVMGCGGVVFSLSFSDGRKRFLGMPVSSALNLMDWAIVWTYDGARTRRAVVRSDGQR